MVILNGAPTHNYETVKSDLEPFIIKTVNEYSYKHKRYSIDPKEITDFAFFRLLPIVNSQKTYRIDTTMNYLRRQIWKEIEKMVSARSRNVVLSDDILNPGTNPLVEEMVFLMLLADEVRSTMGECNYADLLFDYYEHDMKPKDIMKKYNLTGGQYRGIQYRAKKQLLEKLKQKGIDGQ